MVPVQPRSLHSADGSEHLSRLNSRVVDVPSSQEEAADHITTSGLSDVDVTSASASPSQLASPSLLLGPAALLLSLLQASAEPLLV